MPGLLKYLWSEAKHHPLIVLPLAIPISLALLYGTGTTARHLGWNPDVIVNKGNPFPWAEKTTFQNAYVNLYQQGRRDDIGRVHSNVNVIKTV